LNNYRFQIQKCDIFRAVNDTANSALKTGLLISDYRKPDGGTTCQMHAQELVLKHALGLAIRKRNKTVIDSFPAGKNLRDQCKSLASKIMDKKQKNRLVEYNDLSMSTYHVKPCRLLVPNDTRVSGTFTLFTSMLRAKSLLQVLVGASKHTNIYSEHIIDIEKWKLIAEFHAVMSHTNHLAKASQGEDPGEISFSWFEIACCRAHFKNKFSKYKVVDTTQSWAPNTLLDNLPKVSLQYSQMSVTTRQFIDRLIVEFDRYFPRPDSDQLIAMKLHPIMQTLGIP